MEHHLASPPSSREGLSKEAISQTVARTPNPSLTITEVAISEGGGRLTADEAKGRLIIRGSQLTTVSGQKGVAIPSPISLRGLLMGLNHETCDG